MQTANIMLALGGDGGTMVPKAGVTASEIAVLRAIHGNDSVTDVEPAEDVKRTDREEIARLRDIYGRAMVTDAGGSPTPVLTVLFPGAGARAVHTIDELDIPKEFFKAKSRVTAKSADEDDEEGGKGIDRMKKAELVDYAESNNIEIDASANKADVLAAIKAAESGEDKPAPEGEDGKLFG